MAAKNLTTLAVLLFVFFTLPTFASSPDGQSTVILPFTVTRSLMLVKVTVDRDIRTLAFDTGSETTVVFDVRNVQQLATVTLGGYTLTNVPVDFLTLNQRKLKELHADGVLGQDVLSKFHSVTIDYKAHTIELVK